MLNPTGLPILKRMLRRNRKNGFTKGLINGLANGFTMIELIIVVVLVGIVAAIAMPRMNTSQFHADAAMRTLQAALQQAHRMAIQSQSNVIVSFDTVSNRIRIVLDSNNNHIVDEGETIRWKSLEDGTRFSAPPNSVDGASGNAIAGDNISLSADGMPTVYYRRNGAVSTNFSVYLRSSKDDRLTDFRGLLIAQATGRVELYRLGLENVWHRASY